EAAAARGLQEGAAARSQAGPGGPPGESQAAAGGAGAPSAGGATSPASPASPQGPADQQCQVLVLGGGPGGYSAAFRAADLGLDVILVERYPLLGGVCLNVGCIPSKALLHVAEVIDETRHFSQFGVHFGEPRVDLDALRAHKDRIVGKLTGGLAGMAKARKVRVLRGHGQFADANHVEVDATQGQGREQTGNKQRVRFEQAIIAAGSEPVKLPFIPDDPRIMDSTGALELADVPGRLLVIGGGIIGLEMASVYSTLGSRIEVVEMLEGLMPGADRDLVRVWQKYNEKRFDRVMLNTRTVKVEAHEDGIHAWFEGAQAPEGEQVYDLVLSAVGRRPNGNAIGAE
ncbi:MAG: dihydrolipoyl dehydrogenase family protein, partial [Gammaproteobacteria bacterium]